MLDKICDKIKDLLVANSDIRDICISHKFEKIRIDWYKFLPMEKILALHNDNTH